MACLGITHLREPATYRLVYPPAVQRLHSSLSRAGVIVFDETIVEAFLLYPTRTIS